MLYAPWEADRMGITITASHSSGTIRALISMSDITASSRGVCLADSRPIRRLFSDSLGLAANGCRNSGHGLVRPSKVGFSAANDQSPGGCTVGPVGERAEDGVLGVEMRDA